MVYLPKPNNNRFIYSDLYDMGVQLDPETKEYYSENDYDPVTGIPGCLTSESETLLFQKQEITITLLDDEIKINRSFYDVTFSHPSMMNCMRLRIDIFWEWHYEETFVPSDSVNLGKLPFSEAIERVLEIVRRKIQSEQE